MWHFFELSDDDDEFEHLLKKVESEYRNKDFVQLGIIKHITGLFLKFSNVGLYCKTKEEILNESKLYIKYLKDNNQLTLISPSISEDLLSGYGGLGFQGREFEEFQKFASYINEAIELAIVESMPSVAQDLLISMQNDLSKFDRMICPSNSQNVDMPVQKYYELPILKGIDPVDFLEKLLIMKHKDQRFVFYALTKRYKFYNINKKLIEELEWLKSVQQVLLKEANRRKSKVSGYCLELLNEAYLKEIISMLETESLQA